MPIGLGPKRDDRRRRVFRDELGEATASGDALNAESPPAGPRKKRRRYALSARRKRQPTVMDLIPRRWWTVLATCLSVLAVAGLISAWTWSSLHSSATHAESTLAAGALQTAELAGRANTWFCSVLCLASALISLQIFLIRRHRGDDYRGYYAIWLWTAGICLVASFNIAVGIHRLVASVIWHRLTGNELSATSWSCDLILLIPVLLVSARLIWEMWESRAKWGIAMAGVVALASGIPRLVNDLSDADRLGIAHGAVTGVVALFVISFLVYARYTLLDAHGLAVQRRQKRRVKTAADESTEVAPRKARRAKSQPAVAADAEEQAQENPTPRLRAHRPEPASDEPAPDEPASEQAEHRASQSQDERPEDASDAEEMIHSLSKAQKKRQSKKQRRQQRRAA